MAIFGKHQTLRWPDDTSHRGRKAYLFAPSITTALPGALSINAMPTSTVLAPHYSEKILLNPHEIIQEEDQNAGLFRTFVLHNLASQISAYPLLYIQEAAQNPASLKISQPNHGPDPREPFLTITTTTAFSMTHGMAEAMCQRSMDARPIRNAAGPTSDLFKERGSYRLTPKGLHVLERFISKNETAPAMLSGPSQFARNTFISRGDHCLPQPLFSSAASLAASLTIPPPT